MNTDALRKIGLSEGETSVYLAVLRLGLVGAGPVIKETGLQSSSIYHILDSLLDKGIISFEIKNKRKYFYAVSPERLLDFLDEKKNKLEEERQQVEDILPELSALKELVKKPEEETLIFEGWRGIFSAFKEAYSQLIPGITIYAYVITKEYGGADPKQVVWLINKVIEIRKILNKKYKKKIVMKIIAEKDSEIGAVQSKTPHTQVKFIEHHFTNPTIINIYGDVIILALWLKKPIAFYIKSKEVAESFKNNFKLLWDISK